MQQMLHRKSFLFKTFLFFISIVSLLGLPNFSYAYPVFAQQGYENPRQATGRIVCANCHLAKKPVDLEVPQSVLPNTVFEAGEKNPY